MALPELTRAHLTRGGIVLALAAALATSGCAAGQLAQTADEKSSIDGVNASVGDIDLRAIAIEAPPFGSGSYYRPGTAAAISGVFVNNGRQDDTITSISTSAAGSWAAYPSAADATAVQDSALNALDRPTVSPPASPDTSAASGGLGAPTTDQTSGSATESAPNGAGSSSTTDGTDSTGSAASTDSNAATPGPTSPPSTAVALPTGRQRIALPAGDRVGFGVPSATGGLLLRRVAKRIYPGTTIRVTFTFARAGTITVAVPVALATDGGNVTVGGPTPVQSDN